MADEDSTTQSQSSRSSTPNVSNPGTPRQELNQEVRATPPLAVPSTSSTVQRTIPGQPQPPSSSSSSAAPVGFTAVGAAATTPSATPMVTPPQQQGSLHQLTPHQPQSKYSSLLAVIEDMGRDIRPTYAGNRTSSERLKRSIVHARILVRECLMECERSART
ncbi:cyclin-dependent kinase 2-associated protein 1-like [Littorina saxatilis]